MIYDPFCFNTSLSITVNKITGHCFAWRAAFLPSDQICVPFKSLQHFYSRTRWTISALCFKISRFLKRCIESPYESAAACSEGPDTILLFLPLSGGGKASLLNAFVLTSIMTVSRIEKPSRKISLSTQWWLTASEGDILTPHTPKQFKAAVNITATLPPSSQYLRGGVAGY